MKKNAKKENVMLYKFIKELLEKDSELSFAEVKEKAELAGHTKVYSVIYGRVKLVLGLVKVKKKDRKDSEKGDFKGSSKLTLEQRRFLLKSRAPLISSKKDAKTRKNLAQNFNSVFGTRWGGRRVAEACRKVHGEKEAAKNLEKVDKPSTATTSAKSSSRVSRRRIPVAPKGQAYGPEEDRLILELGADSKSNWTKRARKFSRIFGLRRQPNSLRQRFARLCKDQSPLDLSLQERGECYVIKYKGEVIYWCSENPLGHLEVRFVSNKVIGGL